jgi:lysophospholipase L1-like esterase
MKQTIFILSLLLTVAFPAAADPVRTQVQYLSGTGADDTVQWDFLCSDGAGSGRWSRIAVPSQWELQGFGEYTYGRYYFGNPDAQPSQETGLYRHTFRVPAAWKGREVDIVFDGVMTDALVKVNGKVAGEVHRGAFYRFSYRITGLLRYGGTNRLEVLVKKQSDDASVNNAERRADWWLFGGIYRPVWLRSMPKAHIGQVSLDPRADGSLRAVIEMENAPDGASFRYVLKDLAGRSLGEKVLPAGEEQQMQWGSVAPWECEHPNLYDLEVSLLDGGGKVLHTVEERIGFRTVELRPRDGLYVNGTKVILKGVNRHCFHPESGRTTSEAQDLEDARLIRQMNMNAVRSHYPPDARFLDMCDSLGIFYLDELAGWHGRYSTETGTKLLKEMVNRDVNHPCILIWDNGNEGGWNTDLDPLFAELDPQRRHVVHPWADFDELDTHHYPAYLTGVHRFTNGYKVFMPTEFMHANYDEGAGAGLEDFWANYTSHPLFAGGFIWAFVDESVVRVDKGGILDAYSNMGNDGIVGPYREKEGSFWAVRNIWCPVQIEPFFITPSFDGILKVKNTYLFTDLADCSLRWRVLRVKTPEEGGVTEELCAGKAGFPSIGPGMTGKVDLGVGAALFQGDLLELEAFSPRGESLCKWSWPVRYADEYFKIHRTLSSGGVEVVFDEHAGELESITKNGRPVPLKGFRPVGMKWKFKEAYTRTEGGDRIFVARYNGGVDSVKWTLTADGRLGMDAVILNRDNGGGGFDDAWMDPNVQYIGFTFDFPEEEVQGMKWMGRGPYRVWKNRIRGHEYGLWSKPYNNTVTGETYQPHEVLQYPEFKGYHAGIYWAQFLSGTNPFTLYSETDGLYLRVFTPEQPKGLNGGTSNPVFPEGDISLLLDIPGIKSFKPISQHGPHSQPGNIRIKSGDEGIRIKVWFSFADRPETLGTSRPVAGSTRKGNHPVLFLVGDSTMRNGTKGNGGNDQWGWGAFLDDWFDTDRISVENQGYGGLSSRTFYNRLWNDVAAGIRPGDYVLIQLGHNDSGPLDSGRARNSLPGTGKESKDVTIVETGEKETVYTYGEYIRRMAQDVLDRGGHPILCSLTPRPSWQENGLLDRKTDTFTAWEKAVAEEMGIPFVDLEAISAHRFDGYGREKTATLFKDTIHTGEEGARENARSAAEGLRVLQGIGSYVLPEKNKR